VHIVKTEVTVLCLQYILYVSLMHGTIRSNGYLFVVAWLEEAGQCCLLLLNTMFIYMTSSNHSWMMH